MYPSQHLNLPGLILERITMGSRDIIRWLISTAESGANAVE